MNSQFYFISTILYLKKMGKTLKITINIIKPCKIFVAFAHQNLDERTFFEHHLLIHATTLKLIFFEL